MKNTETKRQKVGTINRFKERSLSMILAIILLLSSAFTGPAMLQEIFTRANATTYLSDTFNTGFISDINPSGKKQSVGVYFGYQDEYFLEKANSGAPNQSLALASVTLSAAAYNESSITGTLKRMGYTVLKHENYSKKGSKTDCDFVAFTIAKKEITLQGKKYYVYPIFIKGTSANVEWYSNFNMGNSLTYHKGFMTSATKVLQFIANNNLIDTPVDSNILWFTGHSRGAAVANLLAGMLSGTQKYAKRDRIYGYTFACPNVAKDSFLKRYGKDYNNIYNYNNPYDIVTELPLSKWGFTRFGKTITMDKTLVTNKNSAVRNSFSFYTSSNDIFHSKDGLSYEGTVSLSSTLKNMYDWVPDTNKYYKKSWLGFSPKDLFYELATVLRDDVSLAEKSLVAIDALARAGLSGSKCEDVMSFFIGGGKLSNVIAHAHCQQLYISWLTNIYRRTVFYPDRTELAPQTQNPVVFGKNPKPSAVPAQYTYKKGAYTVTATAGLNLRKGAGTNTVSLGVIPYHTDLAVTELSGAWGKTEYNGKTGWIYLYYTSYLGQNIKPDAPQPRLTSLADVALGESVNVSWNKVPFASKYQVEFVDTSSGNTVKVFSDYTAASVSYIPTQPGVYEIRVTAENSLYQSAAGILSQKVTVHPDVTVRFMTGDADTGYTEYQTNTVKWGGSLSSQPNIPAKVGSGFRGWYKKDCSVPANFDSIKEDLTVYADYQVSLYTVKFFDSVSGAYLPVTLQNGETVTEQTVPYGTAATAPTDFSFVKDGSHFIGWNKSFDSVVENMVISAVTDKDNYDLPVKITDVSACRYDYGYEINYKVTNELIENTSGRVIVALKTQEGKMITTTESAAYFIKGKKVDAQGNEIYSSENIKVVVPNYDDELAKNISADRAEVYAVANFKTTVPVSLQVETAIADMDPWTDWYSDEELALESASIREKCASCDENQIEIKMEYRSRTPVYTTTESASEKDALSAEGWVLYNQTSKTVTGNWTSTKPEEKENRVINTKNVAAVTQTTYWYKRFKYYNKAKGAYYFSYDSNWATNQGYSGNWEYKSSSTELSKLKVIDGKQMYEGQWFQADCSPRGTEHTKYKVVTTVTPAHVEYQAVDTIYTYYLNSWSAWSEWSSSPIVSASDLEVQTREMRRYNINSLTHIPDTEGVIRNDYISGIVGEEFAGKQITLFVYKVTEASDWTTEYLAQTTVAADGSYLFDPYKLREEPSAITGNYTVTLGIEGSNSAVYLGEIEAPKPTYQVTFMNPVNDEATVFNAIPVLIDGEPVETQTVVSGENAIVPDAPFKEGKTFVGWDMRSTSITQDTEIHAVYIDNTYVVTYIDWLNETYEMRTFRHGETLDPPELSDTESMTALGWDKVLEGNTTVTENMVVNAVYEEKTFTVEIYNAEMDAPMIVQDVAYGESIELPELEDSEEIAYLGSWDATSIDDVRDETIEVDFYDDIIITENTYLYPHYVFENTAATPVISLDSGSFSSSRSLTISCETDSAILYYTLDGSDPALSETAQEYNGPITISESCELRVIASAFNMNTSEEVHRYYAVNTSGAQKMAVVTLCMFDDAVSTFLTPVGSKLNPTVFPQMEGYTFQGAYSGITYSNLEDEYADEEYYTYYNFWNVDIYTITGDTILYLDYARNTYPVTFVDYDGYTVSEQQVAYGDTAAEPEMAARSGFVFTGWDTEAYLTVSGPVTANAVYVPESDYLRLSLDKSHYAVYAGGFFRLNLSISGNDEDPELVWASSDENVACVSSDGTVTAVGKGVCTIEVSAPYNGETAVCEVTVYADASSELVLKNESILTRTEDGRIFGFTVVTEDGLHHAPTAAEVREQFLSEDLEITDVQGNPLSDNDYIGTGTVIRFAHGNTDERLTAVVTGDMDGDGYITNRDAARVARYLVNKEEATDIQLSAIDVNADGRVNNRDASMLARYLVGKETI